MPARFSTTRRVIILIIGLTFLFAVLYFLVASMGTTGIGLFVILTGIILWIILGRED